MNAPAGIQTQPHQQHVAIFSRPFGFYISILLAITTALTFAIAFFTPPISGPFATEAMVAYPYRDILDRFPRDYYWMGAALLLMLVFVAFISSVAVWAAAQRKVFGHIAMLFATMGSVVLLVTYYVQLTLVQASLVNQEFDAIALISQYNPHGLFITLEEAGYLLLSLAILALTPIFAGHGRLRAGMAWLSGSQFVATMLTLAAVLLEYGLHREYRFEVYVIGIVFLALLTLGIMGAFLFRHGGEDTHAA